MNIDASHHIYDGVFAKHKIYDEHYNRVGYTNFVLEKMNHLEHLGLSAWPDISLNLLKW